MTRPDDEAQAKARFVAIQLIRIAGLGMLLFGALIAGGKLDLPREAGYVLLAVGLVDMLIAPVFLTRRWKSPNR